MLVDMHSHLAGWSPDAVQSAETLLEAARVKRLGGIAITDHYDMDSPTPDVQDWIFDVGQHRAQNIHLRRAPSGRAPGERPGLLIGVEIGFLPTRLAEIHRLISEGGFDCVILSLHEYRGLDPVRDASSSQARALYAGDPSDTYACIINAIADAAEAVPEADIIGHFDFFSRYVPQARSKMLYRHAPEAFDRLFGVMIQNEQALEINTGTVAALQKLHGYSLCEAMPDAEIVARYRELGGRLFTLGSDAHRSGDVARYFSETAAWLRQQGVLSCAWLEERRWHTAPLPGA